MSELLARFDARATDARTAICDAHGAHPFTEVVARARRLGAVLYRSGQMRHGERVAVLARPSANFVSAFFGILYAGGCVVVLSPLHPAAETMYFCEDAGVRTVLVSRDLAALGQELGGPLELRELESLVDGGSTQVEPPWPNVASDDAALQLYTSGTTGKPKGAVITHANIAVQQALVGRAWGFDENDVLLHTLPLHHMHGLAIALLTALGAGASATMRTFDAAAVWEAMAEATVFMGVPAMYHRLFVAFDAADARRQARWSAHARNLRLATSGSAALPVSLAERWRELTGNIPLERFGMTEIGVGITNRLDGERFAGCVGFPLPTVETRILADDGRDVALGEPGELLVRGPSVFNGYHRRPEETAVAFAADPNGGSPWFRTGDTVMRDTSRPGAPFRILGRTSVDILKSGGYKLSALEIEEALRAHAGVAEVAVVGVPDDAWGDRVVACVIRVRSEDAAACDADALRGFVRERLASYKVPKDIVFVDELPRNALGKVVKPELIKALSARDGSGDFRGFRIIR